MTEQEAEALTQRVELERADCDVDVRRMVGSSGLYRWFGWVENRTTTVKVAVFEVN